MQTRCIVFYFVFPIFLEGCCVDNRQKKKTGLHWDVANEHYRAVEGEIHMFPCLKVEDLSAEVVWSRMGEGNGDGNEHPSYDCGVKFVAETKHSGQYTCRACGRKWSFHLQVVEKSSMGCSLYESGAVNLLVDVGGKVPCPGLNCSDNTDVRWYKMKDRGVKAVSEQRRASCEHSGWLQLCQVSKLDTGLYFCDRQITEQGVKWIFRRAVNVTVIPYYTPSYPPRIMYPEGNSTEEVELGHSHTLECRVYFPVEILIISSPEVQWYMNYNGNTEHRIPLQLESPQVEDVMFTEIKVTQTAVIKEVTPQHVDHTYACVATNTIGSSSVTIKLKKKHKVKWPSLVGYPIGPLLLVAGLGILLHVKWLELQLIFRCYFQFGKQSTDEKEFDVFLSYVWSGISEVERVSMLSSRPDTDEEGSFNVDLLNSEEGSSIHRPLEALLPQVLEDQWGFRLCLLDRDVLPGGAYTSDVVLAIQKSQMLICILSSDYLSNTDAVFVLESGLQALLNNSTIKLLLIWTDKASASQIKPDPPLPTLVQRALKVLPTLEWTSGNHDRASRHFWRSLRMEMPSQRVQLVSFQ